MDSGAQETSGPDGSTGSNEVDASKPDAGSHAPFSQCRFHFGTTRDAVYKLPSGQRAGYVAPLDFYTAGWMGYSDTFSLRSVCDDTKPGALFEGKIPFIVSYLAAFYAKNHAQLTDCNVGSGPNLCVEGAQFIRDNMQAILDIYEVYAQGFASCYGTTRPIVFLIGRSCPFNSLN